MKLRVSIFLLNTLLLIIIPSIKSSQNKHKNWIVITSINSPTKAVKQLAKLPDWHTVVVADKKTPHDWSYPNAELLTIEKQLLLNYRITKLLPWNHYTRKNIGYLYAIQNGAKCIYDTDDDNFLIQNRIDVLPASGTYSQLNTKNSTCNIYAYFGQPTVWPRGYPLEKIVQPEKETTISTHIRPLIQQGLVNGDPDVDAIFRLTRNLNFNFSNKPEALTLPKNTLCPFNSQSTLFHYDAFWGLLIPMATPFRVCDIWRGYFSQRLLWDIDGTLCFVRPQAIQERNMHNYHKDFIDEIMLYTDAGKLVELLRTWQSNSPKLSDRMLELTNTLIKNKFYKSAELNLMQAWIADLNDIGYKFPKII